MLLHDKKNLYTKKLSHNFLLSSAARYTSASFTHAAGDSRGRQQNYCGHEIFFYRTAFIRRIDCWSAGSAQPSLIALLDDLEFINMFVILRWISSFFFFPFFEMRTDTFSRCVVLFPFPSGHELRTHTFSRHLVVLPFPYGYAFYRYRQPYSQNTLDERGRIAHSLSILRLMQLYFSSEAHCDVSYPIWGECYRILNTPRGDGEHRCTAVLTVRCNRQVAPVSVHIIPIECTP